MTTATRARSEQRAANAPPPNDPDAELSVLGSLMLDASRIEDVLEFLRPDDFYRANNGAIFEAALKLYGKSEPIDNVTLAAQLAEADMLERVGGRAQLALLQGSVPTAANIVHYARIVKERSLRRRMNEVATSIARLALDDQRDVDASLQQAQQMLYRLAEDDPRELPAIEAVLSGILRQYEERQPGQLLGLATGFVDVDRVLNGLQPGEVYIVAARPNMGKSSFVLQAVRHVAAGGVPTAVFSLEMSADQVITRILCQDARVDAMRFSRHELSPTEYDRVMRSAGPLAESHIEVDDRVPLDEVTLLHRARNLVRRKRIGLLAIDYLQLMDSHFGQPQNRVAEVTAISKGLKALARELSIPVLAASQLSRAPEARPDKRPELSDLRESGGIEQDACAVCFLFRPEYYKESERPGVCEVIIKKNRYGPTATVELAFRKELTRFENIAREVQR